MIEEFKMKYQDSPLDTVEDAFVKMLMQKIDPELLDKGEEEKLVTCLKRISSLINESSGKGKVE